MNISSKKKAGTFLGALGSKKPRGILMSTLYGFLISIGIGILLTLLSSALLYSLDDPGRFVTPTALVVLYVSALFGGYLSAKLCGGSALLCGALHAAMSLSLMLAVSLLFGESYSSDRSLPMAIGLRGIALALSIAGAMVGVKKQNGKRKRNR